MNESPEVEETTFDEDPEREARADFEVEDLADVELASLVPPKDPTLTYVTCDAGHTVTVVASESYHEALSRHYHNGHA